MEKQRTQAKNIEKEALCATEGEYIQSHAALVGLGIQPSENFPLPVGFLPAFSSTQRPADQLAKVSLLKQYRFSHFTEETLNLFSCISQIIAGNHFLYHHFLLLRKNEFRET